MPVSGIGPSGPQGKSEGVQGPQGTPGNFERTLKGPDYIKDLQDYAKGIANPPTEKEIGILKEKIKEALLYAQSGSPRESALRGAGQALNAGDISKALEIIGYLHNL